MIMAVKSSVTLLLLLMMMITMRRWSGVDSQSTSDDNCCGYSDDNPSVLKSLSMLARYQLAAAKNLDDLARELRHIKTNLEYLQKLPAPLSNNNSCTYSVD